MNTARILVVDDVDVVRLVIGKVLARAGYSVEEACDGASAMQAIHTRGPDVVVTDLWMPGHDGFGLIEDLRASLPCLPVIAMSGGSPHTSMEVSLERAQAAGVSRLLLKPVDKDELTEAVRQALARTSLAEKTG